jgi:hypothetical protein
MLSFVPQKFILVLVEDTYVLATKNRDRNESATSRHWNVLSITNQAGRSARAAATRNTARLLSRRQFVSCLDSACKERVCVRLTRPCYHTFTPSSSPVTGVWVGLLVFHLSLSFSSASSEPAWSCLRQHPPILKRQRSTRRRRKSRSRQCSSLALLPSKSSSTAQSLIMLELAVNS